MCRSMVDIQSPTAEIRRAKKRRKKERRNRMKIYMVSLLHRATINEPLDPFPFFGWLLNKKAARVEVNISLAFLHWVRITFHP